MAKKKGKARDFLTRNNASVFSVWYRAVKEDGTIWAESTNLREVVQLSLGENATFHKKVILQVTLPWTQMKKSEIPKDVEPLDYGDDDEPSSAP